MLEVLELRTFVCQQVRRESRPSGVSTRSDTGDICGQVLFMHELELCLCEGLLRVARLNEQRKAGRAANLDLLVAQHACHDDGVGEEHAAIRFHYAGPIEEP